VTGEPTPRPHGTLLDGVDLVVFDKDGTVIDFHAMWGGWARELGSRLEQSVGRPVAPDVFAAIGFDPSSGHVAVRGPLAVGTIASMRDTVEAVIRRWCPNTAAARRATDAAWLEPDPVAHAVPLADLAALFGSLAGSGRRIAVVTHDDRAPTDATLRSLGVRDEVEAIVAADDGFALKPAPDAVLAVSAALRVPPARIAVVGDTPADLEMGRAAGAAVVIGVLSGLGSQSDLEPIADRVIPSIGALLA
jgi:phosphoglycolate phosphatase